MYRWAGAQRGPKHAAIHVLRRAHTVKMQKRRRHVDDAGTFHPARFDARTGEHEQPAATIISLPAPRLRKDIGLTETGPIVIGVVIQGQQLRSPVDVLSLIDLFAAINLLED